MLGGEDVAGGACALSGMWGASTRQGEESGVQVVGWEMWPHSPPLNQRLSRLSTPTLTQGGTRDPASDHNRCGIT